MADDILEVVVPRDKWLRGSTGTLMDSDGCKCILGMIASTCGVPDDTIRHEKGLDDIGTEYYGLIPQDLLLDPDGGVYAYCRHSQLANAMVDANDGCSTDFKTLRIIPTPDEVRETNLTALAAQADINLTFVDTLPEVSV